MDGQIDRGGGGEHPSGRIGNPILTSRVQITV